MADNDRAKLKGVIPAIITPMDENGRVDLQLLEKQAAYLSEAGVAGFFIGGTTGEGAYLTTDEKAMVFRVVRETIRTDQFLCAAYLQPSTSMVLAEMKMLEATRPDYVVAVTPYYMAMRQIDIIEHYRQIARQAPAPLILYNIPSNTHNPIHLETVLELAGESNIAGIKDSTGNFIPFMRGVVEQPEADFVWIQGEDYLDVSSLLLGCSGVVTGLGNARIEVYLDLYRACCDKDFGMIRVCQERLHKLYGIIHLSGNGISGVKAAAALSGRGSRWMRQKSMSATDEQMTAIERLLAEYDAC